MGLLILVGCSGPPAEPGSWDLFALIPPEPGQPAPGTSRNTPCAATRESPDRPERLWAAELTLATITDNDTHTALLGNVDPANGPSGGEIYEFTLARTIGTMNLPIGGYEFRPRWEVPFTFGVVDEADNRPFFTYSLNIALRWVDFPWNDYLYTTTSMGIGVIYTTNILEVDEERNDGHRAPMKLHWPIQLTLALPAAPQYQFITFSDHSSGGTLWDTGGFDNWGWGFRFEF